MTLTRISAVTIGPAVAVELSFCVVNTEQRELLVHCLDAIAAERATLPFDDRGPGPGQRLARRIGAAARRHAVAPEVIALDRRAGKGENDTALLKRARGRYALLLNEDSELRPGAVAALRDALEGREDAAAAGARLLRPDGTGQPSAWRFPTPATALIGALFLHKRFTVQSRGERTRTVDWAQSAALLVRTDAAREVEWFDPAFFVYSDEVDFCRRLRDAGWRTLYVPAGRRRAPRAALDRQGPRAADRRALAQPRPLHAQAPLRRRRPPRCACSRRGRTRCARSRRSRCPATIRDATGATSPRRCARTGARGCARPRSSTTAARGSRWLEPAT